MIKAIRNAKEEGYTAIDDFDFIYNDECAIYPTDAVPPTPTPPPTTTQEPPIDCDFENGLCGWKLVDGSFKYRKTNAKELSDANIQGPQTDHNESVESKFKSFT